MIACFVATGAATGAAVIVLVMKTSFLPGNLGAPGDGPSDDNSECVVCGVPVASPAEPRRSAGSSKQGSGRTGELTRTQMWNSHRMRRGELALGHEAATSQTARSRRPL